ncbi:MAG: AAA family ATPase [Elainellaceae cyanobacterium]
MSDTTRPALIEQMLRPDFYSHAVQPPIQLVQTHISYVLLTGEYAYKVKKPLDFGFLNYSTLDLRQQFCHEELRLNQRGAAEIYLEVLPITQRGAQYQLGGEGEAVEYTVKMRQFPQDTLLRRYFERGELTPEMLRELAQVIADFHRASPSSDYVRSFGEISQIRQSIDENYSQTEQYIGGPQTQQQFDETRAYTDRFFETQQALFKARIDRGWIRECHGDLHLNNICYWRDKYLLFDCIEFNEPFRFVDVMFDIAYIVMDLEAGDRPDLSTLFLNAYVEQTGDWEGLLVLPLYVSRQSYVRAKVTSFLLGDPSVPEAEKQAAEKTAARYYRLAWRYTQPRQGKLTLMSGLSGSGKSTVGRGLAAHTGAVQIRSDALRKHLGGMPLNARGGDSLYTPEMTQKTYARLADLAFKLIDAGYSVILDAKYDRVAQRSPVVAQAESQQVPLQIIYCDAPPTIRGDRIRGRRDIADATVEIMEQQTFEPFTVEEQPYVRSIDTTQPTDAQLEALGIVS